MKIPAKDLLDVLNAYTRDIRTPHAICPGCTRLLYFAGAVDGSDARPKPGNKTICWHCGHLSVYADDMSLRNPTDAEIVAMAGDSRIPKAQAARMFAQRVIDAVKRSVKPKSTKS